MVAIFKKELRVAFSGLFGYFVVAILLLFMGIFTVLFNILSGYPEFSLTLGGMHLVLAVLIPFLTMRSIAEERHSRTDRLLYSLPIPMRDVVIGKFFAMLALFCIPTAISALYPILLSFLGEVSLISAYISLFGYVLLGATLIAVCMFVSSLVENQILAAVLSLTVTLLIYFMDSVAVLLPTSATASFIVCLLAALCVGALLWVVSKSLPLGVATAAVFVAIATLLFVIKSSLYESLLPNFFGKLALFAQFAGFMEGYFDLTALVLYLSIIFASLFLTYVSMEKRRLL